MITATSFEQLNQQRWLTPASMRGQETWDARLVQIFLGFYFSIYTAFHDAVAAPDKAPNLSTMLFYLRGDSHSSQFREGVALPVSTSLLNTIASTDKLTNLFAVAISIKQRRKARRRACVCRSTASRRAVVQLSKSGHPISYATRPGNIELCFFDSPIVRVNRADEAKIHWHHAFPGHVGVFSLGFSISPRNPAILHRGYLCREIAKRFTCFGSILFLFLSGLPFRLLSLLDFLRRHSCSGHRRYCHQHQSGQPEYA